MTCEVVKFKFGLFWRFNFDFATVRFLHHFQVNFLSSRFWSILVISKNYFGLVSGVSSLHFKFHIFFFNIFFFLVFFFSFFFLVFVHLKIARIWRYCFHRNLVTASRLVIFVFSSSSVCKVGPLLLLIWD